MVIIFMYSILQRYHQNIVRTKHLSIGLMVLDKCHRNIQSCTVQCKKVTDSEQTEHTKIFGKNSVIFGEVHPSFSQISAQTFSSNKEVEMSDCSRYLTDKIDLCCYLICLKQKSVETQGKSVLNEIFCPFCIPLTSSGCSFPWAIFTESFRG